MVDRRYGVHGGIYAVGVLHELWIYRYAPPGLQTTAASCDPSFGQRRSYRDPLRRVRPLYISEERLLLV